MECLMKSIPKSLMRFPCTEFGVLVTISVCFDVGNHLTSWAGMASSQKEIRVKDFKVQVGFETDFDDEEDDKDQNSDKERKKGDEDKSVLDEEKDKADKDEPDN